jgi:hypothetical protein
MAISELIMKNQFLAALGGIFALILLSSATLRAQRTPLPLGTIDPHSLVKLQTCPVGYYAGMTCFAGEVDNCSNAENLGFTYGVENPDSDIDGTIVFLEGKGGTDPYNDPRYAQTYLQQGYQVIYLAWDNDWENTGDNTGNSIKYAACRVATFLQYAYQNVYERGGMCAQGASAGAGALGYALAWFDAGSFLDNVELLSGPVFSDIEQGCVVPNAPTVEVCADGQYGCVGDQWPDSPSYVDGDETQVAGWSGISACNNGQKTNSTENSAWKQMSIVDGTNDPIFNYPQTSLAGWLCSNVNSVQNNSAAQGEFFYQELKPGQTAGLSVTRINYCQGVEGVTQGLTPSGETGLEAIGTDMVTACIKRH